MAETPAQDPNYMEGEAEWSYDEGDPELLLGKTLSVHWPKMNKWYQGTVDKWDEDKGQHHIVYTDGDKRWTRFRERTFSIVGLKGRHEAEECDKYQPKFKGYTPKNPEASSPCHFHVQLDAKWLPEGATPVICGNLPVMGAWEGKGVTMARSAVDPRMFTATIPLPFERKEFCNTGIFEFKVGVTDAAGKLWLEGNMNRRIKTCDEHYYCILRKNAKGSKTFFKGYNQPTIADTVVSTIVSEFQTLLESKITPREFVNRMYFLHGCYKKATRDQGEEAMEKGLKLMAETKNANKDPLVPFALLSVVGAHGISKFQFTEGVGGSKKPVNLKPTPWCWYVLKNIDVPTLMKTDLKETLGPHFHHCNAGLREAAERVMEDEGFEWLRVAPFLKEKKMIPPVPQPPNAGLNKTIQVGERIRANYKSRGTFYSGTIGRVNANGTFFVNYDDGDKEDNIEEDRIELEKGSKKAMKKRAALTKAYDKQWKDLMKMGLGTLKDAQVAISSQMESDQKEGLDAATAAAVAAAAAEEGVEKKKSEGEVLQSLGFEYLKCLVTYAPCTASLELLFTNPEFVLHLKDILPAVADWVASAQWVEEEIGPLRKLVEKFQILQAPEIAEALFKSKSCVTDEAKFVSAILEFSKLCCMSHTIVFESDDAEPGADAKEGKDKKANNELLAKFVRLDQAAYTWFKNGFATRPNLEERVQVKDGFVTKWENRKLSPPEQEVKLLTALEEACDVINRLMEIQYFRVRSGSLLFELARCRCLKGESSVVLKTIACLGQKYEGFMNYKEPLADFLTQRAVKILAEVVPVVAKEQKELTKLLDSIAVLRRESNLSHTLLFTLAATAGGREPTLGSILNFEVIWSLLFKTRGSSPTEWKQNTELNGLLKHVHAVLSNAAVSAALPRQGHEENDEAKLKALEETWKLAGLGVEDCKTQIELGYDDVEYMIYQMSQRDPDWQEMVEACNISKSSSDKLLAACRKFGTATMETMNVIKKNKEQFLNLLGKIGCPFSREMLDEQLKDMLSFDTLLKQTNTFLNFYCDCGVPITVTKMQKAVKTWTEGYNKLILRNIKGLFKDEKKGLFQEKKYNEEFYMAWLYELQTSRLFLNQWRTSGRGLVAKLSGRDAKSRSKFAALDEDKDDTKLTRKQVFMQLLPSVEREWKLLKDSVGDGSITVPRLEETFATLSSDEEYVRELLLLTSTGDGEVGGEAKWTQDAITKLKDFSMLLHMKNSIPAILKLRTTMLASLFASAEKGDQLYTQLKNLDEQLKREWSKKTLLSLTELVAPVKKNLGAQLTSVQLRFLTVLADKNSEQMVEWLLKQKSQAQFNQMKQFVNDSGGEANIVNAVASLVTLRTQLLRLIYPVKPYASLKDMIHVFRTEVDMQRGELTSHLESVTQSFAALYRIIKGGKESAGIKACKDIIHFLSYGVLSFKSSDDPNDVLVLEPHWEKKVTKTADGKDAKAPAQPDSSAPVKTENLEFLLDLRSKIVMTEIPAKMEREYKMSKLVAKFLDQLQVALDIKDLIFQLYQKGHFAFQTGYKKRIAFTYDAEAKEQQDETKETEFQREYVHLQNELSSWNAIIKRARTQFYYLNFFTMREILKIVDLLLGDSAKWRPKQEDTKGNDEEAKKEEAKDEKQDMLPKVWKCPQDTFDNKLEHPKCLMCGLPRPEAIDKLIEAAGGLKKRRRSRSPSYREKGVEYDSGKDLAAMLTLANSSVDVRRVQKSFSEHSKKLKEGIEALEKEAETEKDTGGLIAQKTNVFKLESLGRMLDSLLDTPAKEGKEGKAGGAPKANFRAIPQPGSNAKNRADMLVQVDDEENLMAEKRLPIFVTCAESAEAVIEVVLSVYVRRGRIPEPSEILFCSSQTTLEEIELIFYRFISAKKYSRGHYVFTVADIHALPYTYQVAVLEKLREMLADFGTDDAAQLLMVSGKPRQVLLNSLSGQMVELGPLDQKSLSASLAHACKKWCGETTCVSSNINGGGKTHYVLSQIGMRQAQNERFAYRRVPYHESSTSGSLVARLSKFAGTREKNAFHIDIGHIIPANANTCLFELLIVGVLKNPETCAVYARSNRDVYYLEIPNSERNKTAEALRFPALLPKVHRKVGPDTLSLVMPTFKNPPQNTLIALPNPTSLDPICYVTHFLKAYKEQKFLPGAKMDMNWNPAKMPPLKPEECYALLKQFTENKQQPGDECSFLIFDNFVKFMNAAFRGMDPELGYFIFTPGVLQFLEELKRIKHVFCNLMIETSKDFTLRAVPRGRQFGRVEKKHKPPAMIQTEEPGRPNIISYGGGINAMDNDNPFNQPIFGAPPPAAPALSRTPSIGMQDAQAQQGGADPEMVRQASDNLAVRFQNMMKWDDTDHPVCIWYESFRRGGGYEGINILSLNRRFLNQYISPILVENLKAQGLSHLDKDWSKLTSEEAMDILKKVEGWRLTAGSSDMNLHPVNPGYVITIDNLLKMLSIQLRLRNGLPVMIMGETGCGKSSLIRQLTAVLRTPLRTLNIHGGMEAEDIVSWMKERIEEAEFLSQEERVVIFLDEVNTCNCMGLFKEIICDRSVQGRFIPPSMKIIAACNPYRLKSEQALEQEAMAGLAFDTFQGGAENIGTGIRDPLKNLVYRVHPLPESMIDHVFDFGALPAETEALYVAAILKRQLSIYLRTEEKKKDTDGKGDSKAAVPAGPSQGTTKEQEMERIRNLMAAAMRGDNTRQRREARHDLVNLLQHQRAAMQRNAAGASAGSAPAQAGPTLTQEEMKKLMEEMETKGAESPFQDFVAVFAKLISAAQEYVRKIHNGERSVVSLRDVARAVKVFCWFGEHFANHVGGNAAKKWGVFDFFNVEPIARDYVRRAMIMALAYCYHARLGREDRKEFGLVVQKTWEKLQEPIGFVEKGSLYAHVFGGQTKKEPKYGPRCQWLELNASRFSEVIDTVMRDFVEHINIPSGIALNEALLENLFMIMISILNKIPIFVVGKPGTSKSLAMGLIQANMNGEASENAFLRSLPPVDIFSYQCSPLSTSDGIEQAFQAAARYKISAPDTICVVLLDEVGLAEQSPHLPLKVLHKVLDEDHEYTLVGISNWALDPAKMNRAVHLYRPAPTVTDLSKTAQGMVQNAQLSGFLRKIARAYVTVYEGQKQQDFWGLREFYSTVRHINRMLAEEKDAQLNARVVMNAVQRNFGGKPKDMTQVLDVFYDTMGISRGGAEMEDVVELIRQNIKSKEARHLMLLTKNNAALSLLFDYGLRKQENTEVIFGSDFPADKTDLQVCLNLQNIKLCMAEGRTVVLVYCEDLYESLYDLLNQHYTEYGGKLYVRLAFGTASRLCEIHRNFRVIVVVEKIDAYNRLAPPLLNRFEKQVMERSSLLTDVQKQVERNLRQFTSIYAAGQGAKKPSMAELRSCFTGFHNDMISSLVQSLPEVSDIEETTLECINRLLWLATPESACRVMSMRARNTALQQLRGVDAVHTYFKKQHHSDFITFAENMFEPWARDNMGVQAQVLTFAPMSLHSGEALGQHSKWKKVTTRTLHELSSERDLRTAITDFFDTCSHGSVFVLQCDPQAASFRRIEHARYIIEHARSKFLRGRWQDIKDRKAAEPKDAKESKAPEGKASEGEGKAVEGKSAAPEGKGAAAPEGKAAAPEGKGAEGKAGPVDDGPPGVHVVVLVHLPRGDLQFLIDFDKRWRMAFVDDIEPAANTGLPDIQAMLNTDLSMQQIMELLDLKRVLLASFRRALARLVYLHERTNEDVKEQIGFLLHSLRNDKQFIEHVQDAVKEIVGRSGKKLELMQAAKKEEDLALAGTFQAALHRQILDTLSSAFALLLSHMDRNTGLFLLSKAGPTIRDMWLYLFARSTNDLGGFQLISIKEGGAVEVVSDGSSSQSFRSKFPFSFFINRILTEARALTQDSENPARALQSQFALLNWDFGIAQELDEETLLRYCYDFTCINAAYSSHISREQQSRIVHRIVCLAKGEKPTLIAHIHAYFWKMELTLTAYFGLVDAVPSCLDKIMKAVDEAKTCGPELDLTLLQHVITVLAPEAQNWQEIADYGDWMTKFEDARPIVEGLISIAERLASPPASLDEVANKWEKLLFTYTFIRDVSVQMKVEPALTLKTLAPATKGELRTCAIFRAIVKMFSDLRYQIINPEHDYKCPITLEDFKDPVKLIEDGRVYERAAIVEWLETNDISPMTGLPLKNKAIEPATEIKDKLAAMATEDGLKAAASRFMEFYLFELCFGETGKDVKEQKLIIDFVAMLAGKKPKGVKQAVDVVPSDAGKSFLLRKILEIGDKKLKAGATKLIYQFMGMTITKAKCLGTNLCVNFSSVQEQIYSETIETLDAAIKAMPDLAKNLDHLTTEFKGKKVKPKYSPETVLTTIAHLRHIIVLFAHNLAQCLSKEEDEKEAKEAKSSKQEVMLKLKTLSDALEPVFLCKTTMSRSIRMFFLKNLERSHGISFLRSALQEAPLKESKWLKDWKDSAESGLLRFLGANKLPHNNPFKTMPYFSDVQAALAQGLAPTSGGFNQLEMLCQNTFANAKQNLPALKAALLAALFHQCYLDKVLPEVPSASRRKIDQLASWVQKTPALSFCSQQERELLAFFCWVKPANGFPLELSSESKTEDIILFRMLVHVAAAALGANDANLTRYLYGLIFTPEQVVGTWMPCMMEDAQAMAVRVLGGRWYKCSNGHAYFVDKCGRPTVVQKCATCGVKIGGLNHNLLPGQVDLDSGLEGNTNYSQKTKAMDKSEPNYCLKEAKEETSPLETVRNMTPIADRTQRFLVHCALLCGSLVRGNDWSKRIQPLFNKTFAGAAQKDPKKFLLDHVKGDWKVLTKLVRRSQDDLGLLLHTMLNELQTKQIPTNTIQPMALEAKKPPIQHKQGWLVLDTIPKRDAFETQLGKNFIDQLFDSKGITGRVEAAQKTYSSKSEDEAQVFTQELMERSDIKSMPLSMKQTLMPALWRYRAPFSLEDFSMELNLNEDNKKAYPVLSAFLSSELNLRALRYFPAAIEFQTLCLQKFNRALTKDAARKLAVSSVLSKAPDKKRWSEAFKGYRAAWDLGWKFVERFTCLEIPQMLKNAAVDEKTPITMILPQEKDEGICGLGIMNYLSRRHNQFVEIIYEKLLLRGQQLQRNSSRKNVVSSKFFAPAHALTYDLEGKFIPFVAKQCVSVGEDGARVYNFDNAEQYLLDVFFVGKPLVEMELRMVQYTDDEGAVNTMLLKEKVDQEPLTREEQKQILTELGSPAAAHSCMRLLETCISFLQATGGSYIQKIGVGDKFLLEYVKDVLLMKDVDFGSHTIQSKIKLKHIDSLWKTLRDFTVKDPFENVHARYKEVLDTKEGKQLQTAASKLDLDALVPTMQELIIQRLTEPQMSAKAPIADFIGWAPVGENFMNDLEWFKAFPSKIEMKYIVDVYKMLSECHTQ